MMTFKLGFLYKMEGSLKFAPQNTASHLNLLVFMIAKMGLELRVLILVAMTVCLPSAAYAAQGTATFYTPPYVPSSCNGYQNDGVMIAAASDAIWGNRAACGRRYSVKCIGATNQGVPQPCKGNSVVVKIVDYCPPGCRGTIDLSQEAFAAIANPDAGKIKIEYTQV